MRTPSPPNCRLDLAPPLADRFIIRAAPSITARYFSSCPSDPISRWTPCPPQNQPRPCGQRGITPAFGYGSPHLRARGTSTLLNNALLSAQFDRFRRRAKGDRRFLWCEFLGVALRPMLAGNLGAENIRAQNCPPRHIDWVVSLAAVALLAQGPAARIMAEINS
jgi:hypothetical protein